MVCSVSSEIGGFTGSPDKDPVFFVLLFVHSEPQSAFVLFGLAAFAQCIQSGCYGAALVKGSAKDAKNRMSCRWCGFPLKEGDTHCEFCMTPVADIEKGEFHREESGAANIIPPKRLLCYVLILVAGIIFAIVTR